MNTQHIIDFTAAGLDWQAEVEYDGCGFSVIWADRLDCNCAFECDALDAIGCLIPERKEITDRQTIWWPEQYVSLRSLALATAERNRDAIDDKWRDETGQQSTLQIVSPGMTEFTNGRRGGV